MTTAEAMALEVLKGDLVAARALADLLVEEVRDGGREMVPVEKIVIGKTKGLLYCNLDVPVHVREQAAEHVQQWITNPGASTIALTNGFRLQLFTIEECVNEQLRPV